MRNPLYVATYNATTGGKLQKYIQGVNPDKVELEADEKIMLGRSYENPKK